VIRMGSIIEKGCLNRRVFCEPFPIAIHHNPSQSITIHRNPSQSIAIHRNPSQSFAAAGSLVSGLVLGWVSGWASQDWHHRFELSHKHKCSNRNRIGAYLLAARRLSVRSRGVGDVLQTDRG
jgi:hypothetical protein